MQTRATVSATGVFVVLALTACGGSKAAPVETTASDSSSGAERDQGEGRDELAVSGLRGTLSQEEVKGALEPRMPKLSRCVQKRSDDVEWVSGSVHFEFHVALDGSVASVYPSASSMGDRETERCMLELAKSTRFPAPHGGEADFAWSLEVPLDSEVRAPVEWTAAEAGDVIAEQSGKVSSECGGGGYRVTAYIDPEGKVVAAGVATSDAASAANLDCVAQAVSDWTFESPGSYAAKLSFGID